MAHRSMTTEQEPFDGHELSHTFGAITSGATAVLDLERDVLPGMHFLHSARIMWATIRNSSAADITVTNAWGTPPTIESGERKRVAWPQGTQQVVVKAGGTVNAGELTADIKIRGCRCGA